MDTPASRDTTAAPPPHDTKAAARLANPARPAGEPGGPHSRRSRRRRIKGTTAAQCYGNAMGLGRNIAHSLLDVSETGVRMLLKSAVALGDEVEVNLVGPTGVSARQVARVVWVVPAAAGLFCVGCDFLKPVPPSALAALARI